MNKIVSRSRKIHPQSPPLTIGGTVLKEFDDLVILSVTFDSKMTFEKHLRSISRAVSQRFGILRKSWPVFHDISLLVRCFRGFVLPVLEYCFTVWWSSADTHLQGMDQQKKLLLIHLREKRFKPKIIMSYRQMFVSRHFLCKENYLVGKYGLLLGPAENASSPTISQIEQNLWFYFIYKQ